MKNKQQSNNKKLTTSELNRKIAELEEQYQQKVKIEQETRRQLAKLQHEFDTVKRSKFLRLLNPATIKRSIRTIGAYVLGRRNRKRLYSKTYKRKQASNDVKKYTYALYNEGFTERVLSDLEKLYTETTNRYLKSAIAWEMALWYANKQTPDAAYLALPYIKVAKQKESDSDLLRRIAIVEAECLQTTQQVDQARQVLHEQLQRKTHPDVYLALANLEQHKQDRIYWMNKTLEIDNRKPIKFSSEVETVTYDDLYTIPIDKKTKGPKISVILPAYNSEQGIQTAIESILNQTWENIELLIVDDCSTDRTLEVIHTYAKKDQRIKVFSTETNSGPYVARNIALQAATGEFVTVNDADDWSHAEKLAVQVTHLINNPEIIANTSEQARLTEDLYFYRRGTPGKYIFSNMSSLMFRRVPVLEKIGYWDTVRFAADGEFKRRLIRAFGREAVVDLQTGPLSLPRQSATSLTGSSAFGYDGFFMGARREYVESFTFYHEHATTLYYPAEQTERLFPVPAPMLPTRLQQACHVDIVMATDFYDLDEADAKRIVKEIEKNKQLGLTTGIVQMARYRLNKQKQFHLAIRELIDGKDVQMLVYGEKIMCKLLIIRSPSCLQEKQRYMPKITTLAALIIIDELPSLAYNGKKESNYNLRRAVHRLMHYFDKRGRWYPLDEKIRAELFHHAQHELASVQLAVENWINDQELHEENYTIRIKDWLLEQND